MKYLKSINIISAISVAIIAGTAVGYSKDRNDDNGQNGQNGNQQMRRSGGQGNVVCLLFVRADGRVGDVRLDVDPVDLAVDGVRHQHRRHPRDRAPRSDRRHRIGHEADPRAGKPERRARGLEPESWVGAVRGDDETSRRSGN